MNYNRLTKHVKLDDLKLTHVTEEEAGKKSTNQHLQFLLGHQAPISTASLIAAEIEASRRSKTGQVDNSMSLVFPFFLCSLPP